MRPDPKRGAKWLRRAAEQGLASAQGNLGYLYGKGEGVPRDLVRAHMWFSLAVSGGSKEAGRNREALAQGMTEGEIREAQEMARQWLRRSRERGGGKAVGKSK